MAYPRRMASAVAPARVARAPRAFWVWLGLQLVSAALIIPAGDPTASPNGSPVGGAVVFTVLAAFLWRGSYRAWWVVTLFAACGAVIAPALLLGVDDVRNGTVETLWLISLTLSIVPLVTRPMRRHVGA
jgi:ABC-type Fe3+-siderophore transport system permease subunit